MAKQIGVSITQHTPHETIVRSFKKLFDKGIMFNATSMDVNYNIQEQRWEIVFTLPDDYNG